MKSSGLRVLVIGDGVIGSTTAIALAKQGYQVTQVAGQPYQRTTSARAAAFWYPYGVGNYEHRWAARSWDTFRESIDSRVGIAETRAVELLSHTEHPEPKDYWWSDLPGVQFRRLSSAELPPPLDFGEDDVLGKQSVLSGLAFRTPVINMALYLPFLARWKEELGVNCSHETWCSDLSNITKDTADGVVNCTGHLAPEILRRAEPKESLRRLQGQVVRVPACPGVEQITLLRGGDFNRNPVYVVPRTAGKQPDIILGGTFDEVEIDTSGSSGSSGSWELPEADAATSQRILRRCSRVVPQLEGVPILEATVGLRPVRSKVRLELDSRYVVPVVHNYGHGGAGVTLAWGCAEDATALMAEALQ